MRNWAEEELASSKDWERRILLYLVILTVTEMDRGTSQGMEQKAAVMDEHAWSIEHL
jgi:hypothetical protein